MGKDPWSYDFYANRVGLETLIRYAHARGLIRSLLAGGPFLPGHAPGDAARLRLNRLVKCQGVHTCDNTTLTRSGVKGTFRSRAPVALKIALPITAGAGIVASSPRPVGSVSG